MESTIQQIDNKTIAIISAVLLLLMAVLIFHAHTFTTTTTVHAVEVMKWSTDTCWAWW